jgi:hypothetical protein
MGPKLSVGTNVAINESTLKLFTSASNECVAKTVNNIEDLNFIINGSDIDEIVVLQSGTASADCIFDNNIGAISKQLLDNLQNTETETGSGLLNLGIAVNVSTTVTQNELSNAIEQSIYNLCSATSTNTAQRVNYTISASNIGNITLEQDGSSQVSCVINNLAKIDAQSNLTNESNTTAGGGGNRLISIIIAIAIIGIVTTLLLGIFGKVLGGKKEEAEDTEWIATEDPNVSQNINTGVFYYQDQQSYYDPNTQACSDLNQQPIDCSVIFG